MAICYIPPHSGGSFKGDYNDLKNVPLKDNRDFKYVNITFDGNLEGRETVNASAFAKPVQSYVNIVEAVFVRVSDTCPPVEGIDGEIKCGMCMGGEYDTQIVTPEDIHEYEGTYEIYSSILFLPYDIGEIKQGVYFVYQNEYAYISSVEYKVFLGGEIQKLDNMFLPNEMTIGTRGSEKDFESPMSLEEKNISDNPDDSVSLMSSKEKSDLVSTLDLDECYSLTVGLENVAGFNAVATGSNSGAIAECSHAEGVHAVAEGYASHAEGSYTNAWGDYSHAEGKDSEANGDCSHAEGYGCIAYSNNSHAEGYETDAWGEGSHSEGYQTHASGKGTHVEGYKTSANSDYQHVQGKYNIPDYENKYAHIVGNGDNNDMLSNAHTLDWQGNAWFAGNVTVGADKKELSTKEYVNETIAKAQLDGSGEVDTSNFAFKSDIPTRTSQLTNDSQYVTESGLTAKGYLTEHQDVSGLASKSYISEMFRFDANGYLVVTIDGVTKKFVPVDDYDNAQVIDDTELAEIMGDIPYK